MRSFINCISPKSQFLFSAALATSCLLCIAVTPAATVGLVYVEAQDDFGGNPNQNLLPAAGGALSNALDVNASALDSKWGYRPLAAGDTIYESTINANPGSENSPELVMTLDAADGLVNGTNYDIYVAYWSSGGGDWSVQGRLATGPKTLFNRTGPLAFLSSAVAGTSAASAIWSTAPLGCVDGTVTRASCTIQADRSMLLGKVGTATATGGQIQVFIDDLPTTDYPADITAAGAQAFRSWFDGVAFVEEGTPLSLQVTINRDNGQLSIANNTGGSVSFTSLSINSASQALNPANWTSITANYDQGAGLDTDAWEITAPTMPFPTFAGALTEIESAGAGTVGATLASGGAPINFGNVWKDTRFSDVQVQMTLVDGTVLNLAATYTGIAHLLGDLSNNGSVGLEDYQVLTANLHSNVSTLGQAEAYLRGDMNGDLLINYADFAAFRAAFPGGSGAFDAMAAQVPEPATTLLVVAAVFLLSLSRGIGRSLSQFLTLVDNIAPHSRSIAFAFQNTTSRTSSMIRTRDFRFLFAVAVVAVFPAAAALAVNVNLTATDVNGLTTSFNGAGTWNNAAAPSAGNNYFTGNFGLRTPADGGNYLFGGDSLTVNNTNFDPMVPGTPAGGLWYKGTGNTGIITINNLILDGGLITHINGLGDLFQLAGNINIVSNSYIQGRQGPINILANISGTGTITNPNSDGDGRIVRFMSPDNTYSGSIVNNGRFELSDNARMNFVIGASGVNNSISGTGAQNLLNGDFNINLTGAGTTLGNSWTLVSATNRTFGDTFNIPGFLEYATGSWVKGNYQFSEATGALTVAPPPELLTLRINTTNGQASILNGTSSTSFDMNYYEIRSASGSLSLGGWTSIDGNIAATSTTWEKAGGSTANLISETNLLGMKTLGTSQSTAIGAAYAGNLPAHQDLQFFYGTTGSSSGTLFGGFVEYVTSTALLGDFNGNGKVDAADYTLWRNNFGMPEGTLLNGNGNGGNIDQTDYALWKTNFGTGGSGSLAGQTSSVPEPATIGLMLIAACGGLLPRRTRQA